jgi:hypothetical protein
MHRHSRFWEGKRSPTDQANGKGILHTRPTVRQKCFVSLLRSKSLAGLQTTTAPAISSGLANCNVCWRQQQLPIQFYTVHARLASSNCNLLLDSVLWNFMLILTMHSTTVSCNAESAAQCSYFIHTIISILVRWFIGLLSAFGSTFFSGFRVAN